MPNYTVLRAALLALTLAATAALATPFAVQLGDTRLVLDTPPGFSDAAQTGSPRVLELAESLTSASNRILLFGITDADLRRFSVGDTPELRRYLIAVTPRSLERYYVAPKDFERYVQEVTRDLAPPPPQADARKLLDAAPAGLPVVLAELRREPALLSFMQGARIEPPEKRFFWEETVPTTYLLSTTTLLLLRDRALNLSIYTGYAGREDLEWLRATTQRWVEELQRLNRRL
ncbi:MAG: hypothetical protein R3357_09385 [Burkholderiales bacterium]|nr:hypothetical protein [Burkholderiales bacterium]